MSDDSWYKPSEKLPEYTTHATGNRFCVIIASFGGMVTETLYEEGEWKPMHIDGVNVSPDWWRYMPVPPVTDK